MFSSKQAGTFSKNAHAMFLICVTDATYLVLMTARNGDGGVVIQLHTADDRYEEKVVTGQTLSAEYGETSAQLTLVAPASAVSSSEPTGRPYVAILPFNGSLGLLKFHVGRLSESKLYTINLTNKYNCSLAAVFRIQDEHFSLPCYNSEIGRLTFLQLNLDTDILSNSAVPDLQYPSLSHLRNLTNFVHVELPNNTGHLIYFGTGSEVLYYKPLDFIVGVVDARLDEHKCFITKLSYTGGWEMLAYCADGRTMYINTATEDVFYTATLARDGQPYVCPDLNIFLSVHSDKGYIQYGLRSTKEGQKFTAQLDNVYDGVCLESSEQTTLFVFADRERGTRLLDVSGNYIESLSNSTCTSSPCQPLVFLDNCYLALREQTERGGWHILLFDTHHNFSLALDVSHTQADLMAVIKVPWTDEPKVTDGVANPEVMTDLPREVATDSTTSSPGASDGITLIALVVVAIVVIAIFIAIGVVVVIWKG